MVHLIVHFSFIELLMIERKNVSQYHENIVCGLYIKRDPDDDTLIVKVLFSGNSLHSSAMALNLVSNTILKMNSPLDSEPYHIHTINEPIRKDKTSVSGADLDMFLVTVPLGIFFFIFF